MKKFLILPLLFISYFCYAQKREINYDESKVPSYQLPDLLQCENGEKVTNSMQWEQQRRPEIMEMFASQMYGRTPDEKIAISYQTFTENETALNEKATSKQVKFTFTNGDKTVEAILLMYIPNKTADKVPVFVGYNFKGNHSTTKDTTIVYSPLFHLVKEPDHPDWERGIQQNRWPFEMIIDRGYAVATMCYHDIFPDKPGLKDHSVAALFSGYSSLSSDLSEWEAIGAWAWGSSRIADFLETEERIDTERIAIMGHSRQGKAALWAGAQDERFKIVIPNNSGAGGAALSKREFGETIAIVSSIKPPWFCAAFNKYRENETNLPFDQHQLLALIAPRKLYVASAEEDLWADPKGEFLSLYHAGPVFQLYGLSALDSNEMPELNKPIMKDVGYHIRDGVHDVTDFDWSSFLDFADKHFSK